MITEREIDYFASNPSNASPEVVSELCRLAKIGLAGGPIVDLIREEAAKDNSPFGRSDSLALANIRAILPTPTGATNEQA